MSETGKEDILNPSLIESRIIEGRFGPAKLALKAAITKGVFNSAHYPLHLGANRPIMYAVDDKKILRSQPADLGLRNIDGHSVHTSYSMYQEGIPSSDNGNLERRGDWGDEAVILEVEFKHATAAHVSHAIPVARLTPATVEWAKVRSDGHIQWQPVDVFQDTDRMQAIRQIIDTVG